MPRANKVAGYCPNCGGESLFLGEGGYVTCSRLECGAPTLAAELLDIRETDHIVELTEHDFRIIHPLKERVQADPFEMFDCELHQWLKARSGPPMKPGRYIVRKGEATWHFEAVAGA